MSTDEIHDRAVQRLATGIQDVLAGQADMTVLTGARWQPMDEFPTCVYRFDVLVTAGPCVYECSQGEEPRLSPQLQVVAVFDVIRGDDYETEYYDKPDLLITAAASEYCLIDPTGEQIRPRLHAVRRTDSGYELVRSCKDGVFFSDAGVRIAFEGTEITVTRSECADLEEEVFALRKTLGRESKSESVAALERKIEKLEREKRGSWARTQNRLRSSR